MDYQKVYDDGTIKIERSEHGWHLWTRPAVTILLVKNNKIITIHEKKDSTGRWVFNCPGGMINESELSEDAARREAEEEIGLIPQKLEKFATIQTDFPDTYVDYYLGKDLKMGIKKSWSGEEIDEIIEYTWSEMYQMALECKFNDPRLVVAILQLSRKEDLLKSHGL